MKKKRWKRDGRVCEVSYLSHRITSGASGQAFMDISFAQFHGFKLIRLQQPRSLVVADGRDVTSGPITHFITTPFTLRDKSGNIHTETLDMFVTKLGQYPIILGIPWFRGSGDIHRTSVSIKIRSHSIQPSVARIAAPLVRPSLRAGRTKFYAFFLGAMNALVTFWEIPTGVGRKDA